MALHINGQALTIIRERTGYSVADLARAVGVTPAHLTNVEHGARGGSPSLARRLADVLEVPLQAILRHPEPEPERTHA